jgi:hypothetical protein
MPSSIAFSVPEKNALAEQSVGSPVGIIKTRNHGSQQLRTSVPLNYPLLPGDTIKVDERWF